MEILVITILFLAALSYNYLNSLRRDKAEIRRFQEFVIADKSKNINEYVESLPANDVALPSDKEDEIVELEDLTPEELLAIRQKELK